MADLGPFFAGAFSGAVSTFLFQPLEVVKTRLQLEGSRNAQKRTMRMLMVSVAEEEGVRGLWRGLIPSLLRTVPGIGIYFSSVNWTLKTFCKEAKPKAHESLVCGMVSRVVSGVLTMPFTVLKTRFESGVFHYSNVSKALLLMTKKEGLRANFQGLGATVIRDVPYSGIYFMFYNQIKDLLVQDLNLDSTTSSTFLLCSATSSVLSCIITHPPDVLKTRLQMQATPVSYSSTIKAIYTQDGVNGFFQGLLPRLIRRTLMSVIAWTSYEKVLIFYKELE